MSSQHGDAPPGGRWADAATWEGEGLCRKVFLFNSRGRRLYGSLYRAASLSRRDGIVICPSWGVEADRSNRLMHGLAFSIAKLGGAALIFHYPGYGDSEGDLASATMESLAAAAAAALQEAERRVPDCDWMLAGFTVGASVACLAQRATSGCNLLLLQPELCPGSYFREIARKAKRASFSDDLERLAFGYPAPQQMLDRADELNAAVKAALVEFESEGFAVAYASPGLPNLLPKSFQRVAIPGTWRFGARSQPGLHRAAIDWLGMRTLAFRRGKPW
jgi:hypothetical protein